MHVAPVNSIPPITRPHPRTECGSQRKKGSLVPEIEGGNAQVRSFILDRRWGTTVDVSMGMMKLMSPVTNRASARVAM